MIKIILSLANVEMCYFCLKCNNTPSNDDSHPYPI